MLLVITLSTFSQETIYTMLRKELLSFSHNTHMHACFTFSHSYIYFATFCLTQPQTLRVQRKSSSKLILLQPDKEEREVYYFILRFNSQISTSHSQWDVVREEGLHAAIFFMAAHNETCLSEKSFPKSVREIIHL